MKAMIEREFCIRLSSRPSSTSEYLGQSESLSFILSPFFFFSTVCNVYFFLHILELLGNENPTSRFFWYPPLPSTHVRIPDGMKMGLLSLLFFPPSHWMCA